MSLHVCEVLMYFNRGSLPWQGLKANSKKEHLGRGFSKFSVRAKEV